MDADSTLQKLSMAPVGASVLGQLIAARDWSDTPLGPMNTWPHSLRTALNMVLASQSPMALCWGPDLRVLYNDAIVPILGSPRHPSVLGLAAATVVPEIWPLIEPLVGAALEGQSILAEHLRLDILRDGQQSESYFTLSMTPVEDDAGRIAGILVPVMETTALVIRERRLKALRQLALGRHTTAVEVAEHVVGTLAHYRGDVPFALIYLADAEGRQVTRAAAMGVPEDPTWAPATLRLDGRDDPWGLLAVMRSSRATGVRQRSVGWTALPDEENPSTARVLPLMSSDARHAVGVLIAGMSARIRHDDEYLDFFDLVASQTGSLLATARAYEDQRQRLITLTEIDHARTSFFSSVSHELRTPLSLILAPVEDGLEDRREPLTPGQRERQEIVRRNALRILKLVNGLLDFSRVEAMRQVPAFEALDLAQVTADIASTFRALVERAGLQLRVDCEPLPWPVHADRQMWETILLNLLSNAFKFTLEGEIRVRVDAVPEQADPPVAAAARLTVQDTGVGIAERHLPHIFERFYRVGESRGRSYEGSGIGLALVRELVVLHHGTIEVTSVVGQGTTFTVTLPIGAGRQLKASERRAQAGPDARQLFREEAASWTKATPKAEALSGANPEIGRSFHILVAEDNADMRAYLARLLSPIGRVSTASDGAEALEALRQDPPDLLLLDGVLPVVDSLAVLRAVRQDPDMATMPVVMLSSRASEDALLEGTAAGADHYLVKPFVSRELVAVVRSQLMLAWQRQELYVRQGEFRAAFDASTVGMCQCEPDTGRIVLINRRFCDMLGYSADELIGRSFLEVTHPDDRVSNIAGFLRLGRGEVQEYFVRKRFVRRDGPVVWADLTVNLVRGPAGRPLRTLAIIQDVTEQVRLDRERERLLAEEREAAALVARSRAQLAAVFAAVQDGVVVFNRDGEVVLWNHAYAHMIDFDGPDDITRDRSELRLRYSLSTLDGQLLPQSEWPSARVMRGERVHDLDLRMYSRKSNREWIFSFSGAPIRDEDGQEVMAVIVCRDITERARAKAELLASRERLARDLRAMTQLHALAMRAVPDAELPQLLEEHLRAAIDITGATRGYLEVIDRSTGLLQCVASVGNTPEELARFSTLQPRPPLPRWTALTTGERVAIDDSARSPLLASLGLTEAQRALVPAAYSFTPLKSRAGAVIGLLMVAYDQPHTSDEQELRLLDLVIRQSADVVERLAQHREVEELRATGRRKEEFLVAVADPVIIVRQDGCIEYANALAEKVFGYAPNELLGQPLDVLIPERLRAAHTAHLARYFANPTTRPMGMGQNMTILARRKDGSEFPAEVSLGPIPTSAGVMVSTVVRDVTERLKTEEAARQNAARLSSAVEVIADLVAIWGDDDRLVTCNSAYRELLREMTSDPLEGMSFADFCACAAEHFVFVDEMGREAFLNERLEARDAPHDSFEVLTRDGHVLWFTLQRTAEGGDVLTGMDISEDIRREDELESARREAEAASRAKSEFLSSMSHELRTPLNAVLGFAQLLLRDRKGELSELQREMVRHIYSGGTHLLRLIDDILDLARIEASGIAISPEPVAVLESIQDVLRTLSPSAAEAGVTLSPLELSAAPMILVDRGRFAQILLNFGSNAIKYNRPGGSITFTVTLPEPGVVRVAVEDTGYGISEEHQARLFQPFHRAGQETGSIEGSGIGLAICKRLAEVMRGSVGFESRPGVGSTFWVNVPVHTSGPAATTAQVRGLNVELVVTQPTLVLCVDDNPASITLLETLFSQIDNVKLISASSAEMGIELARARVPDLILMDIHLPGITGMDALRLLRGWPETQNIPVIALTAAATELDRMLGRQAGFEQYLVKPVRIDHLEAVIHTLLRRREQEG